MIFKFNVDLINDIKLKKGNKSCPFLIATFLVVFFELLIPFFSFTQGISTDLYLSQFKEIETSSNLDTKINKSLKYIKILETLRVKNDTIFSKTLDILGLAYWDKGELNKAKLFFNSEINFNFSNQNHKNLAIGYLHLAGVEYELQEYKNSLINYDNCIVLLKKIDFRKDHIANSYRTKASIYFIIGDYENCISNSDMAIQFSESNAEIVAKIYVEKIQALIELRKYENLEKLINKTISSIELKLPKSLVLANLYSLYGTLLTKNDNLNLAQKYFKKSLNIHYSNNYKIGIAQISDELAYNKIQFREYDSAESYANKIIENAENDQTYILRGYDELGVIFNKQNKFEKSLRIFQKAFSIYFKKNFEGKLTLNPKPNLISGIVDNDIFLRLIQHKAETWLAYYHHNPQKEYLQNALETFAVADKMVDYMRQEHVGYQSKLYWRDKTHRLYENAIETCFLLKNYEKAFYFFEKSRAVLLNDKINNLAANQLLSDADQMKERGFQEKTSKFNAQLDTETNESTKSQINIQLLDVQEDQQKFIKSLALKYPTYFTFKYDTSMYSLAQFKQYLRKRNTSFIEYFKGDSANYQLVIKSAGINIIKQKPTENNFQYLTNTSDLGERVIISQDGEFVPLDTLKNSKKEYLLNKYAFSYTYSAQYLLRNENNKALESSNYFKNFIGFAPVNYSKSMALPSLMGAEKALDKVSQNYFWPHNFQNEKATKSNFKRNASDYKIIQLFTHADADNISKEPTIFFADSSMKVSELESIGKFKAELLVLSACKTNVGKIIRGEGTLSMAREFAGLGIPASITTLWSVENDATYQITELFYKYLKKGEPKDLALQKAKLEFLETNSREKQNPKYWSAFVLMGEVNPLIIEVNAFYWLVGILALVTILVIIYFIFRSKPVIIK